LFSEYFVISSPSRLIDSTSINAGGVLSNRIIAKDVTLLPQPLSPTKATHSPFKMSMSIPSTALTIPCWAGKITLRFFKPNKTSLMIFLLP
jgi:hypothetical protein